MATKRKFIINVNNLGKLYPNDTLYISNVNKNACGYFFILSKFKERAKIWHYKKSCDNIIAKLTTNRNPLRVDKKTTYKIIEITELVELRRLKLNKLK